jgi:hypothetical protein
MWRWRPRESLEPDVHRHGYMISFLADATAPDGQDYERLLYGLWLVGFSETPFSLAAVLMAFSVRPSLRPMTRVGVFCVASERSWRTSAGVQGVPEFLVDFDMWKSFCWVGSGCPKYETAYRGGQP